MKKLSIIIPAYNEASTVASVLARLDRLSLSKEIIVVDDGSTDDTPAQLRTLQKQCAFRLLTHDRNRGKGAAIKTALPHVTGDYVLIHDADLEYDPAEIPLLVNAITPETPVVYGSRNLQRERRGYFFFFLGGVFLTFLTNILYSQKLTDINTAYKLIPTDLLRNIPLKADRFEFCEEVTARILKSRVGIKEVPIHYYPRKFTEGKKIRARDGLIGMWTVIKHAIF